MNARTNVVFILSDQHNAKCLGHQGHPDALTPNLDRMAGEGVRFDRAVVQSPICTPSRVSYLSGQYCHNHGYFGLEGGNPGPLPSLFSHFRQSGYRTAAIGKIHCPEYWVEDDCDVFHETARGRSSIGGRSTAYTKYLKSRHLEELEDGDRMPELDRQSLDARPSGVDYEASQEGWAVREALSFIRDCQRDDRPFALHLSLSKPHQCYTPARQFWDLYDGNRISLPPNADDASPHRAPHLIAMAEHYRNKPWQAFEPKTFEAGRRRKMHGYLGNISHMDHAVGQMLDGLSAAGLDENTIVVYAADHGDYACEHGLMEKAPGICHDAITRVPFIWRWPGHLPAGTTSDSVVEAVDVFPTLARLAGLPRPETADGQDLTPLLHGEAGNPQRLGVTELPWSKSVRRGNMRFVFHPREMFASDYPEGFGQLYNLEDDPWETNNLYFDPAFRPIAEELRSELFEWMITTTRPRTVLGADLRLGRKPPENGQYLVRGNCWMYADGKISPQAIREALQKRSLYI